MKTLYLSIALFAISIAMQAQTKVSGKVLDAENQKALVGANVQILNTYKATATNLSGYFELNKVKEDALIKISYIGYEPDTIPVSNFTDVEKKIYLQSKSYQTEAIIVNASRLDENAPASATTISKEELMESNQGKDMPYLLQQSPSVVSSSDGGAGIGYTSLRIRGSDVKRINVTMNGVPLNDAESHTVIWANMPDIASSLESIQIQRGLGTSSNGSAAFGASINLESGSLNKKAFGEVNNSYGSFNSRKHTVKVGSGLINDHFVFEGRLSQLNTEGYIDRANAKLQSYFTSGAYYGDKTIIKALVFGGKERTYQSWYGTPESRYRDNLQDMKTHAADNGFTPRQTQNLLNSGRSYNYYLYENQIDNYQQNHYQLHFTHEFSKKFTANLSFHYTKGEGYFEEYKRDESLAFYNIDSVFIGNDTISNSDLIRRRWLDNDFYGFTFSTLYQANEKLEFNLGGGLNNYVGDHFGEVIWAEHASNSFPTERYYYNEGKKMQGNIYLKTNYQLSNKVKVFADLQLRNIHYEVAGKDNDQRTLAVDEDFLFFNPKIGANWQIDNNNSAYIFMGIGNREPNRSDFTDLPLNTPRTDAGQAEKMRNLEVGYEHRKQKYYLAANYYLMDYDDQLVNTGHLNDVGASVRQNVDRSYRTGIELQAAYQPIEKLKISVNATYSKNKIMDFTEKVFNYDNGQEEAIAHGKTDIAFSPEIITGGELNYQAFENLEIAWLSRYIGAQYLDNTSNEDRRLDAYFLNDLRLTYSIPTSLLKAANVQFKVNNIFSSDYASNGYTYSFISGEMVTENFYFPQAFRNYMLSLNLKF